MKINEEPKEPVVKLELCQIFQDNITVKATLVGVASYYLVSFKPDGTFYRHENVSDGIGFQVENDGRLVEIKQENTFY